MATFSIRDENGNPLTMIKVAIHCKGDSSSGVREATIDMMLLQAFWYDYELAQGLFKLLSDHYVGKSYYSLPSS